MGRADDTFQTSIGLGGSLHPSLQLNVDLRIGKCSNRNAKISLLEVRFLAGNLLAVYIRLF